MRLREKQKAKKYYGIREKQFMRTFAEAERWRGNTGEELFVLLERRLDSVLCRSGIVHSRAHARQAIAHGNVDVNGKRVDRPSYLVSAGDVVARRGPDEVKETFRAIREQNRGRELPAWLEVSAETPSVRVARLPLGEEVCEGFQPQYIVEICSR